MPIRTDEVMIVKGRWTQVGFSFRSGKGYQRSAVFLCECGNRRVVTVGTVVAGTSLSCGCLCLEINDALKTKHGHSRVENTSSEYQIWTTMKQRCENPNMHKYPAYGGRGITVCEEWHDFSVFLADMGPRPEGCSIERINNHKGYSKDNCRWASRKEQQRNRRTNNLIEFNGKTQCLTAWAEELGMSVGALNGRMRDGWSVEKAFTTPVQKRRKETPMKHFIAILFLFVCATSSAQSIMISGGGQSIAVSGSAAVGAVPPAAPVPSPGPTTEPFQVVPSPPPKFVEPPAEKPAPAPAPAPAVTVRRVTQRFLIVTAGCPACPAAKAAFEAAGNPRENIISPSEAMRRFGVSTSYVPYEFTAQVDVQTQASRPVQSAPVQRQRLPVVRTQWGTIDLETYNRNCNCSMCQGIRNLQQQYRSYRPTSFVPEMDESLPADQQPTPDPVMDDMLGMMGLTSADTLADIGCGDGRVLIAAARRYGCRGVGIEIDETQANRARQAVASAGLDGKIRIITGDARAFDPQSHGVTAITVYLFPELLRQLAPKLKYARVVASPFHEVPGLEMSRRGDVWLYRPRQQESVQIQGFDRNHEIDHLMDPRGVHGGRFTRSWLSGLSDLQLIDLHNREHGVSTVSGELVQR